MASFAFTELPVELQDLILSFLDYPNLITTLTVSKHINELAVDQPLYKDKEERIRFLISLENAPSNLNAWGTPAFADESWRWPNYSPKNLFICFLCSKIKPLRKFAHGQCYRMMMDDDYTIERKRFCLDCGTKRQEGMGLLTGGGRKYVPGAMINSVDHGFNVHLCGGCEQWVADFFCMKDKLCFPCTEKDLQEPEEHVHGFKPGLEGPVSPFNDQYLIEDTKILKRAGVWDELLARMREDEVNWPRRPPCCRKCGGKWRFHPRRFGWEHAEDSLEKKRPKVWRRGYNISGTPCKEIVQDEDEYMKNFCPYPSKQIELYQG
ncbi:hypothetical protein B0O99DRAFT_632503 [Bisporella sp. PMI_857]|nr:hypothetical protein B0O99DRAFT_632503 [Bisporella sp. PMI_857]